MDATFEDVVKLAEQLNPEQQNLLIYRLRVKQSRERTGEKSYLTASLHPDTSVRRFQPGTETVKEYHSPTREELIHEVEILRQTPVRSGDTLLGKYASPNAPEMSEEEFHAQMYTIVTEWEQELDEFTDDES